MNFHAMLELNGKTATGIRVPSEIVCILYTSDAADERSSVDLGGRRIIKKKICESTRVQQ